MSACCCYLIYSEGALVLCFPPLSNETPYRSAVGRCDPYRGLFSCLFSPFPSVWCLALSWLAGRCDLFNQPCPYRWTWKLYCPASDPVCPGAFARPPEPWNLCPYVRPLPSWWACPCHWLSSKHFSSQMSRNLSRRLFSVVRAFAL